MQLVKSGSKRFTSDKKDSLLQRMDVFQKDFLESAEQFLITFWTNQANTFLNHHNEITSHLSLAQKEMFEIDLNAFLNNHKHLAKEYFNQDKLWWNRNQNGEVSMDRYKSATNLIDEEGRRIFGKIGQLLYKHKFIGVTAKPYFGYKPVKGADGSWEFEFVNPIYWSETMKKDLDQYWELYKFFIKNYK